MSLEDDIRSAAFHAGALLPTGKAVGRSIGPLEAVVRVASVHTGQAVRDATVPLCHIIRTLVQDDINDRGPDCGKYDPSPEDDHLTTEQKILVQKIIDGRF